MKLTRYQLNVLIESLLIESENVVITDIDKKVIDELPYDEAMEYIRNLEDKFKKSKSNDDIAPSTFGAKTYQDALRAIRGKEITKDELKAAISYYKDVDEESDLEEDKSKLMLSTGVILAGIGVVAASITPGALAMLGASAVAAFFKGAAVAKVGSGAAVGGVAQIIYDALTNTEFSDYISERMKIPKEILNLVENEFAEGIIEEYINEELKPVLQQLETSGGREVFVPEKEVKSLLEFFEEKLEDQSNNMLDVTDSAYKSIFDDLV